MECEEEKQGVCSSLPDEADEEEDGDLHATTSPIKETDPPAVRIIPIPVQPENSCGPTTLNHTENHFGVPQSFKVNGRVVPVLPGGGGCAELKLLLHPKGSASGFTTVQIPVTLTIVSPAGSHHINTTASLTAATNTSAAPNPATALLKPEAAPPIITGVVSGEAAQKVLSDHNVNFKLSPSLKEQNTLFHAPTMSTSSPISPWTIPPASQKTNASPSSNQSAGQLDPVSSPDCRICLSQYKLTMKLRGFMCLCSPLIAQSLKNLKKNKSPRWSRHMQKTSRESQSSRKVSRAQLQVSARTHRFPDGFLSDQITSSISPSSLSSLQQDHLNLSIHGKLVILVEDLYYGSAQGQSTIKTNIPGGKFTGPYHCIQCPMTLCNNLELMSHVKQHVPVMSPKDRDIDSASSCSHCYRHFPTNFKLQRHLEAVHNQCESTVTCRICELDFGSEVLFLWHMKNTHKPGEMPYVCQVCDFRSSFYSDVWSHFQEAHADTKHLLCQYCLRVLHSNTCYQQHFARHQKKHIFGCDKCRLHFLYMKELMEHKSLHHRTYIRPPQLDGLKSGTKVTVRTFSVVGGADNEEPMKKVIPCKVVHVNPPPLPQEAVKRRPMENLGELLSSLSQEIGVCRSPHLCVECLSLVQDFRTHFPSLVYCSLCRFLTCCSTSYANHMINNHASYQKNPQYQSIFQTDPRLSNRLECESCKLCTNRGDMMASHLSERPDHYCKVYTDCSSDEAQQPHSVTSPDDRGQLGFIPIHLLPCNKTFSQLSIKPLNHPSPLSSPPAMTITFLGPSKQPKQIPACPLSVSQLAVILSSLCHGLSQASYRCQTDAAVISSWTQQLKQNLWSRNWGWKTYRLAQWLLRQREQQLVVSEDVLLQEAKDVLGKESQPVDCYSWTVDFMLRHDAILQSRHASTRTLLPRNIKEKIDTFIQSLRSRIVSTGISPHHVGCMDEISIFIDSAAFNDQNPLAFKLFGSPEDKPVFDIVLSALSDGTLLTPLLFFRGTPSQVPEGFPSNVLLEAQQEGFTDQERLHIWINKVWQPHVVVSGCGSSSVLLVDVHRGHQTEQFRDSLSSVSTEAVIIPLGCCCRLQPLDVCVTPVLRDFLQARWTQLVSQGGLDSLGLDQLALTLACWLSEVCSILNLETNILHRSFSSVCDPRRVEDRWEAVRMITALNEALVQPLGTPESAAAAAAGAELELLVMEEVEQKKMESRQEVEQQEKVSSAAD